MHQTRWCGPCGIYELLLLARKTLLAYYEKLRKDWAHINPQLEWYLPLIKTFIIKITNFKGFNKVDIDTNFGKYNSLGHNYPV